MTESFFRPEPPSDTAFPVERAGYPFIFFCGFVTAVFAMLDLAAPALLAAATTAFVVCFFRDPDRVVPRMEGAVVAPADGKVVFAGRVEGSPFYDGPCQKISIFMSVFNVHVNRIPHEGVVKSVRYHPGKFIAAHLDKASLENEHNAVFLETGSGARICTVQIAGLIARRIICRVQPEDEMRRGQRFGLICFGSRVDVYLPPDAGLGISVGERTTAGTSVIGTLRKLET